MERAYTQYDMVLNHLKSGKEITPLVAVRKYGAYRLGAIIFNLRRDGYQISTRLEYKKNKNGRTGHYAVYKLIQGEKNNVE